MNIDLLALLTEAAINEMARINNATFSEVAAKIEESNAVACSQFQKLMQVGHAEALKLAA